MKSIALIGFMGSGKSTVGPLLAELIGRPFLDLDSLAEELAAMKVSEVFADEGEVGWRRWESRALTKAVEADAMVMACGGGIIVSADNRDVLRAELLTVYLRTSAGVLIERLRRTRGRPLLDVADPQAAIAKLLDERRSLYESAAHLIVDTDMKDPKEVAGEIAAAVAALTGAGEDGS